MVQVFRLLLCLLMTPFVAAQPGHADGLRLYVFGNSLVHHPDGGGETNVPVWLSRMARAAGHDFAIDGQWGFLRDFARDWPPTATWSFRGVPGAMTATGGRFDRAGYDAILISPTNFIQYQAADRPYADEGRNGTTPLSASVALIDLLTGVGSDAPIFIYEGWADMEMLAPEFPPDAETFARYKALHDGAYHQWYLDFLAALKRARPDRHIELIEVAPSLMHMLSHPALETVTAQDLFADNAPHGTPTLYLMAAMATYRALFGTPPPGDLVLPDSIHPQVRAAYADLAVMKGGRSGVRAKTATAAGMADTGLADPALAMGLNGISDWSTEQPFINVFKTARPWLGHRGDEWGVWTADDLRAGGHLNDQGWPTSLPDGATSLEALILTDLPAAATGLAGRYRVTWEGTGTLRITGRATSVSINEADRMAWFGFSPGDGTVGISIGATDPADPIRNIAVVAERHLPLHQAGALFNPDWLAVVRDLRAVRFMDWMMTNNSPIQTWGDRPLPSDFSYAWRGVPVEVMVHLANVIGADAWFCMPHKADDDFVRAFATYVRNHLDPRLVAYAEYSNEVWNFIFDQAQWAEAQGTALWGNAAGDRAWIEYAGLRAAQVAGIWAEVYGDAAPRRLKRVIAVQTGWPGLEQALLDIPAWRADHPDTPLAGDVFDAYAVTGYFGYELGTDEMATDMRRFAGAGADGEAAAARIVRNGSLATLLDDWLPYHAGVAAGRGFELIMYEGGTHIAGRGAQTGDDVLTGFFTRLNYSPEMAALYDEVLSGWHAVGGTLFNAFVDVAEPSKYGSWGALRYLGDDNPRWRVLNAFNGAGAGWEKRADGAFLHGVVLLGDDRDDVLTGTSEEDVLIGAGGNDVLVGNGGGDRMNGGDGTDTAVLPGLPDDYVLASDGARFIATGKTGDTLLFGIELVQFSEAPGSILDLSARQPSR